MGIANSTHRKGEESSSSTSNQPEEITDAEGRTKVSLEDIQHSLKDQFDLDLPWIPPTLQSSLWRLQGKLSVMFKEELPPNVDNDTYVWGSFFDKSGMGDMRYPEPNIAFDYALADGDLARFKFGLNFTGAHSGESAKSAIHYYLALDPLYVFMKFPFGGSYMDTAKVKPPVVEAFNRLNEICPKVQQLILEGKLRAKRDVLLFYNNSWTHSSVEDLARPDEWVRKDTGKFSELLDYLNKL
jgi:hypothetical protein